METIRWQILNEEIDCTEEEMMLFAALQLQVVMAEWCGQKFPQKINVKIFSTSLQFNFCLIQLAETATGLCSTGP